MVLNRSQSATNGDMCQQAPADFGSKQDSDDEFKWEEFFGTSVDITSTLLDMFDTIVAKNSANGGDGPLLSKNRQPTPPPPSNLPLVVKAGDAASSPPCDPGGKRSGHFLIKRAPGSPSGRRPCRLYSKRSYSETVFEEKKRPLSTSSVSSSSSSSSSSLPRNGLDVKKSYLASIESLDDDEQYERDDCSPISSKGQCLVSSGGLSGGSGTTGPPVSSKPRWCDPNLSHTERVVLEIVDTEKTYVRDLDEIIKGYMKHIKETKDSKVSDQYLEELFSNIEDIHKFNSLFVEELESCGMDPVSVARCFVNNSDGFEVYTQYCTNYPRTVSVLTGLMGNCETAEIFKERQTALQHSLPLGSYLLKPVQRILKYHLLLQSMVKHSDKESEGYIDIKNALSVMTGIAYHINDMKRKHEHAVRVQEIQSLLYGWEGQDLTTYGELVAEGAFRMYRAKALRHLFLFDKMILIAKKKEEGILSYKTHIMCSNLMLIESIQGEPLCFHVIPFDNPRYQYTFQARNLEQKREWCLQLKRVILENYNAVIPSHARQLVMELGQSKHEDSAMEKTSSKRQLSAPEYLEKRKQERRKSEINLKRGLKLKNGSKKVNSHQNEVASEGELAQDSKTNSSVRRKSASSTNSRDEPANSRESWSSQMDISGDSGNWRSQDDVNHSESAKTGCSKSGLFSRGRSYNLLFNRDSRLRHSLPEPALAQRPTKKERSHRPSWRTWKSVPEETTDTENEDVGERNRARCQTLHSADRSYESEAFEEPYDSSGEYVTFFYAHAYATRDWPGNSNLIQSYSGVPSEAENQNTGVCDVNYLASSHFPPVGSSKETNSHLHKMDKGESEQGNVLDEQCQSDGTRQKDQDSESGSSNYSWKQSAAIRRVQSFTGMAKAKMSSLHHNISFKHNPKSSTQQKSKRMPILCDVPTLPYNNNDPSPTTPAAWLRLQEQHFANGEKRSGSLPRSFQLASDLPDSSLDTAPQLEDGNVNWMRVRNEGQKCTYSEQRPYTIASDAPTPADFSDDMGCFVLECSPDPDADYCLLVRKDHYEPETTTGCTNTPAVSLENVHSLHPDLKIYHQAASKYSTLKQVFTSMSSKLANLRAAISHPSPSDNVDNVSSGEFCRSSSRSSIKSDSELGPKMLTTRLAHSVAKAYSAVIKHRTKKGEMKVMSPSKSEKLPAVHSYKSESSLIGARMAHPLESEYSIPKNVISPSQMKKFREYLRPDSLFSESSNATSSSDGDKGAADILQSRILQDEAEDSVSEASESSADSYYERTFDAIESALAEDMFRDSAIYSDPEDADFSAIEIQKFPSYSTPVSDKMSITPKYQIFKNGYTMPKQELICKRHVSQVKEKLRVLENSMRPQRENVTLIAVSRQNSMKKPQLFEKWSSGSSGRDYEESETSSEHSASTVNTVMESSNFVSKASESSVVHSPPRIKGWVKHVVDKLQGEGHV